MGSDGFFLVEIESFACNIRNFQISLLFFLFIKNTYKNYANDTCCYFFIYHRLKECLRSSNFINKFMV
jgi:hypothetical protein